MNNYITFIVYNLLSVYRYGAGAPVHLHRADFTTGTAGLVEVLRYRLATAVLHLAARR